MAKGTYRKLKMSAREGFLDIDVAAQINIVVATPNEETGNRFLVIFRDQKSGEELMLFAVKENQIRGKK